MKLYYIRHKSGYYQRLNEPLYGGQTYEYRGEKIGYTESDSDKARMFAFLHEDPNVGPITNTLLEIKKDYFFELEF